MELVEITRKEYDALKEQSVQQKEEINKMKAHIEKLSEKIDDIKSYKNAVIDEEFFQL